MTSFSSSLLVLAIVAVLALFVVAPAFVSATSFSIGDAAPSDIDAEFVFGEGDSLDDVESEFINDGQNGVLESYPPDDAIRLREMMFASELSAPVVVHRAPQSIGRDGPGSVIDDTDADSPDAVYAMREHFAPSTIDKLTGKFIGRDPNWDDGTFGEGGGNDGLPSDLTMIGVDAEGQPRYAFGPSGPGSTNGVTKDDAESPDAVDAIRAYFAPRRASSTVVEEHDTVDAVESMSVPIVASPSSWMADNAAWMKDLLLADITMPGTHDSGAMDVSAFQGITAGSNIFVALGATQANVQSSSILQQLQTGARSIDLRLAYNQYTQTWHPHHSILAPTISFDILRDIASFMNANRGEVLVLFVSHLAMRMANPWKAEDAAAAEAEKLKQDAREKKELEMSKLEKWWNKMHRNTSPPATAPPSESESLDSANVETTPNYAMLQSQIQSILGPLLASADLTTTTYSELVALNQRIVLISDGGAWASMPKLQTQSYLIGSSMQQNGNNAYGCSQDSQTDFNVESAKMCNYANNFMYNNAAAWATARTQIYEATKSNSADRDSALLWEMDFTTTPTALETVIDIFTRVAMLGHERGYNSAYLAPLFASIRGTARLPTVLMIDDWSVSGMASLPLAIDNNKAYFKAKSKPAANGSCTWQATPSRSVTFTAASGVCQYAL